MAPSSSARFMFSNISSATFSVTADHIWITLLERAPLVMAPSMYCFCTSIRKLPNLLLRSTRARVGHDVDRVHGSLFIRTLHVFEHLVGHLLGHRRPHLDHLVW